MSKAVVSDGTVNLLVRSMCQREGGLAAYPRDEVDAVLTDGNCQQCEYATLALVCHQYREAFGAIPNVAQKHLEIKAHQSSTYRTYLGITNKPGKKRKATIATLPEGDPLLVLRAQTPATTPATETVVAAPAANPEPAPAPAADDQDEAADAQDEAPAPNPEVERLLAACVDDD